MKYITLDTRSVPAIGLGTYKLTGPAAIEIIRKAIHIGYRHIDTAQLYDNEKEIGIALSDSGVPRNRIFITSKVWPSNLTKDRLINSVEESLEKIKLQYFDLLLVHWPHHELLVEEYMQTMMRVQEAGLTKDIGVSNFNIAQLKAALKSGARIVANQIEFHPWINQVKVMEFMQNNQIPLIAYCPFGKGRFIGDKKIEILAAKYVRSPAQIILRWMMQKDNILAIPKSENLYRLEENLHVFDFELSEKEMEMMDAWRLENIRVVGELAGAKFD